MGKMLEPEPPVAVKPRREPAVAIVADIHVEYPYSGDDECVLCGTKLSRYNPHVLCNVHIDRIRQELWAKRDGALQELLDRRRKRNRAYRKPTNVNARLIESVGTPAPRSRHHPQNGHS